MPASYFVTRGICASILSGRHMMEFMTALPCLFLYTFKPASMAFTLVVSR